MTDIKVDATKTVILGWVTISFFCLLGVFIGVFLPQEENQPTKQMQIIINKNTTSIQSLALAAKTQKSNAELLIQILNVLEGNPIKEPPIELNGLLASHSLNLDMVGDNEDIPVTFDQISGDQREIDYGIRSLTSGNIFQAATLHNILKKVRDK
tara:strand:- start:3 stop:464 length:462 start_codon:yes stop_codon:yes gene_type:complete